MFFSLFVFDLFIFGRLSFLQVIFLFMRVSFLCLQVVLVLVLPDRFQLVRLAGHKV